MAFVGGPLRPSAQTLLHALKTYRASLRVCGRNPRHWHPRTASNCGLCGLTFDPFESQAAPPRRPRESATLAAVFPPRLIRDDFGSGTLRHDGKALLLEISGVKERIEICPEAHVHLSHSGYSSGSKISAHAIEILIQHGWTRSGLKPHQTKTRPTPPPPPTVFPPPGAKPGAGSGKLRVIGSEYWLKLRGVDDLIRIDTLSGGKLKREGYANGFTLSADAIDVLIHLDALDPAIAIKPKQAAPPPPPKPPPPKPTPQSQSQSIASVDQARSLGLIRMKRDGVSIERGFFRAKFVYRCKRCDAVLEVVDERARKPRQLPDVSTEISGARSGGLGLPVLTCHCRLYSFSRRTAAHPRGPRPSTPRRGRV